MEPKLIPIVLALLCIVWSPLATDAAELCDDDDDCTSPDECLGGACVPPVPDPHAYVSEAMNRWSSYVWAMQFPSLFEPTSERCCFDYNGDGIEDDGYGVLLGLMGSLPGSPDPRTVVNSAIENGESVKVFDWRELAPDLLSGDVQLSIFEGMWTDSTTHSDRIGGLGRVAFLLESFGDFGALDQLNEGAVSTGTVTIAGDEVNVQLPILFFGPTATLTPIHLQQPRLEVPVGYGVPPTDDCLGLCSIDEDRGGGHTPQIVGGAKLGGLLSIHEMMGVMDDFYRGCSCAGIDSGFPVINWYIDEDQGVYVVECTSNTGDPSLCDPNDPCSDLGTLCAYLGFYGGLFDVDQDGDGVNDSLSVGLRLGFAGTTLDHVPEIFADGFEWGTTMAWSNSVP